jgi:hypothetical protein
MTRGNQTRHQLLSNRSRRSGHKNSHHHSLTEGYLHPTRQDGSPGCDTSRAPRHAKAGVPVAMLEYGWRPLHDERRPQRIVKITSRSASGKAASIVAQGGEIPLDRHKARSFSEIEQHRTVGALRERTAAVDYARLLRGRYHLAD